jgi:ABC-type thiamin/hydroxymethylpyrimidine transport system permease subunit
MLTRQNKIGLVLAFVLGLSDIAILGSLSDDSGDTPPPAIVGISVALGLATIVLVVLAWRRPTWPLMIAIIALRALSALGDLMGLGEDATVVIISLVFLVISLVCIALLRNWLRRPATADTRQRVG